MSGSGEGGVVGVNESPRRAGHFRRPVTCCRSLFRLRMCVCDVVMLQTAFLRGESCHAGAEGGLCGVRDERMEGWKGGKMEERVEDID